MMQMDPPLNLVYLLVKLTRIRKLKRVNAMKKTMLSGLPHAKNFGLTNMKTLKKFII